jgi:hypothetical protein
MNLDAKSNLGGVRLKYNTQLNVPSQSSKLGNTTSANFSLEYTSNYKNTLPLQSESIPFPLSSNN